jgi:hypothetical protein
MKNPLAIAFLLFVIVAVSVVPVFAGTEPPPPDPIGCELRLRAIKVIIGDSVEGRKQPLESSICVGQIEAPWSVIYVVPVSPNSSISIQEEVKNIYRVKMSVAAAVYVGGINAIFLPQIAAP